MEENKGFENPFSFGAFCSNTSSISCFFFGLLRLAVGGSDVASAVILDSRTMKSALEVGGRVGYDGAQRRKGSKVHIAVEALICWRSR